MFDLVADEQNEPLQMASMGLDGEVTAPRASAGLMVADRVPAEGAALEPRAAVALLEQVTDS